MKHAIVFALAAGLCGLPIPAPAQTLPEACRAGSAGTAHGPPGMPMGAPMPGMPMPGMPMPGMPGMPMPPGLSMPGLTDAQKAYLDAVMNMHGPMLTGIQAKDPDVAYVCGMIAHHQGAIAMAQAELRYGGKPEAKRMAEQVIKDQSREIEAMTAWLDKNAKREWQ
jgi:hypothetical protein